MTLHWSRSNKEIVESGRSALSFLIRIVVDDAGTFLEERGSPGRGLERMPTSALDGP